jgi:hypothetical protein
MFINFYITLRVNSCAFSLCKDRIFIIYITFQKWDAKLRSFSHGLIFVVFACATCVVFRLELCNHK